MLKVDQHDRGFVDSYIGPLEWRVEQAPTKLDGAAQRLELLREIATLEKHLLRIKINPQDEIGNARVRHLRKSLLAARTRIRLLGGERLSFDDECQLIYDAVAPRTDDGQLERQLKELQAILPGKGSLIERWEKLRKRAIVPPEKLHAVFMAAIQEARRQTRKYVELPHNEDFTVGYVGDKPWSAYNWYQGNYQSRIEVNIDEPLTIDRVIELAGHEGYPGHHVQNILRERLYRENDWPEFSVFALYSPASLLLEGAANYGLDLVFSADERLAFEESTLYPLAGLDKKDAKHYAEAAKMKRDLYAITRTEVARRLREGVIDEPQAVALLQKYALESPSLAKRGVAFFKTYGGYIINYDIGQKLVQQYVENNGPNEVKTEQSRWVLLTQLLSTPTNPSDLTEVNQSWRKPRPQ
jgi:hypothetical protein